MNGDGVSASGLRAGIAALLLLAAACSGSREALPRAAAAQRPVVKVITSGSFAAAYDVLAPRFEADYGVELQTSYRSSSGGATDSIPVRLGQGQVFDVIILSRPSLDRLTSEGEVVPGSRIDLLRSVIGMAVRAGAPVPDISTVDRFVDALRSAGSIGYSASASGTYLSGTLWPRMGLWDELRPKSQRILSERVASVVARGDVKIGFQQVSEILPVQGVELVGPIPEELQKVTTFSAAITVRATEPETAESLLDFLSSVEVADTIAKAGFRPAALERQTGP